MRRTTLIPTILSAALLAVSACSADTPDGAGDETEGTDESEGTDDPIGTDDHQIELFAHHSTNFMGVSMRAARACKKRAPVAPSTTR